MTRPLRLVFGAARLYRVYSRITVSLVVILQRGRYTEKAEAPEHRPFHRRYNKSFANHLGVDAQRNFGGVRQEKSRCEMDQPGESPCDRT